MKDQNKIHKRIRCRLNSGNAVAVQFGILLYCMGVRGFVSCTLHQILLT
jgi:hypothetical protein